MPPRTKPHCADPALRVPGGVVVQQHVAGAGGRRPGQAVVDRVPAERDLHDVACRTTRRGSRWPRWRAAAASRRSACGASARSGPDSEAVVQSRRCRIERSGGGRSIVGSITWASWPSFSSNSPSARRRASRSGSTASMSRSAGSSPSSSDVPSGKQVQRRSGRGDAEAALDQLDVAPHRGAQHGQHIGAGGGAEAGRELLGDAGAADERRAARAPAARGRPGPGRRRRPARCGRRRR